MGLTNEFERDLEDQAVLKRPGRVDLRLFQNTPDAGDGHPGLQRCFRNYLHEGGIEKDLELVGFGIKGTSVDISNVKLQQLSNIGSTTISITQWEYLGELDQPLKQADSPTFNGLSINGNIVVTGNVDGVDVSDLKDAFDTHTASTGASHTYIDQSVVIASSPTFVGLTLSANLVTSSTIDSVDIAGHDHSGVNQGGTVAHSSTGGRTVNDHHNQSHVLSGGDHTASGLTVGHVVRATGATTFAWQQLGHGDLSGIGSNAHSVIDTHLSSTSNPHTVTLDQTFDGGKIINGANNVANAVQIGSDSYKWNIYIDVSSKGILMTSGSIPAYIGTIGSGDLWFKTNNTNRWRIYSGDGSFRPNAGNTIDIGTADLDVRYLYYCNMSDTSCADFSHLTAEALYNLFKQIKPRTDDLKHKIDNGMLFNHIDFATLPDCFATKVKEDFTKKNVYYKVDGKESKTTINYKVGDNCGIEKGTWDYALKDLVVKQYEMIEALEARIKKLEEK